jgi:branched-chain amino acid transport system substrate-binding protein
MTGERLAALGVCVVAMWVGACGQNQKQEATPRPAARAIVKGGCSPVAYGGAGKPQLLIGDSSVFQGQFNDHGVQQAQALKLVLAQRHWRAGPYRVGLQICDETTAKSDFADPAKCRSNARAFARTRAVVAVLGPHFSSCTAEMLPILNRARGGAIPLLGSTATYLGLTRAGPGTAPHEPQKYYPTGVRNYVRLVPADDVQGAAAAMYVKRKGATQAFALSDGEAYGDGLAEAFATTAKRIGIDVVGAARWDPKARNYRGLAMRVKRGGADVVFLGGYVFENAPRLIRDLRAALPSAQLIGPDGMNQAATVVEGAGDAAENFLATIAVVPAAALPPPGQTFAEQFRRRYSQYPCCFSVNSAQSEMMVLDALASSGADRAKIINWLRHARVKGGLTGDFVIDRFGDTSLTRMAVYRIKQGKSRFETTVSPPPSLLPWR